MLGGYKDDFEIVPKRVFSKNYKHTVGLRSQKQINWKLATWRSGVPEVGVS